MAYRDDCGEIILDAVLTDAGRKRMAQGRFKITKFALGDDEIDYSLYNRNHPSGSAYYDLEVLKNRILESKKRRKKIELPPMNDFQLISDNEDN